VTSDSRVGKGAPAQSLVAPNSDSGQRLVHGQGGNSRSTRDVIESHNARASAMSSEGVIRHLVQVARPKGGRPIIFRLHVRLQLGRSPTKRIQAW
jgi:hypothetical protein